MLGLSSAYRDFDLALLRVREALALGRRFELRKVECETLNTICESLIAQKDLANAE